jgi:hypothetical protein
MATNPNIALSYQPNVALQRRDPLADAANIQSLQANQTKMDDLREFKEFSTRLAAAGKDPDPLALAREMKASGRPEMVMKALELETQIKALGLEDQAYKALIGGGAAAPAMPQAAPAAAPGSFAADVATRRAAMPANALAPAPAAPTNALAPAMEPQAQEINRLMKIATQFPTTKAGMQAMKSAELLQQMNKPYVVGGRLVTGAGKELYAAPDKPAAPPAMVAEYTFAKTPEGGNFQGTYQQFVTARAAAGRAPAQPVAPTITQIQDPNNPLQMITIDARRYQGGGVGSPGVIGTTGKSAPAAAAAQKQEQGATQAQDILDNLKYAYEELDRQRAIPSTQRSGISNILTSIGASGVGQVAGRVTGTEAQTQRDIIASARNQLFAAVKNATGLSAQNLNSNVEFTTWLNSLTDPAKSIEANREILANMEKFIASGGKYSTRKDGGQAAPAGGKPTPAATSSGATVSNW